MRPNVSQCEVYPPNPARVWKQGWPPAYNVEMPPTSDRTYSHPDARTETALLEAIREKSSSLVVTSTVRAARALRQRYNDMQRASGNAGWITPRIMAWEPWLETLWDAAVLHGDETRVLLTDAQELELWRTVLAQDKDAGNTLSIASLAELAQRAWKQMHRYRISAKDLRRDSGLDAQAFSRWAADLEKTSRKNFFLSPAWLEAAIAQHLSAKTISAREEVFLLGFDRVTPAQVAVIEALKAQSCATEMVELRPAEEPAARPVIACAHTAEEEIAAAAHWIRRALFDNPGQRIGVIVSDLERLRSTIDAAFRRVLAPSSMDVCAQRAPLPYEFSLGTSMRQLQPVRTALTLLRWLDRAIPADQVSWLAVHGDFGVETHEEQDARARLDRRFRERDFQLGGPVSLDAFRQWLSLSGRAAEVRDFRRTIEHLATWLARQAMAKSRSFGEWRETIEEALAAAEWRLLAPKESAQYQLLQRWNALLDEFSSLSSVAGPVRLSAALERLEHMASPMLFALETRNAPVQILGIPESAGIVFDSVWWLNAHAGAWPPRGKAQPFLPWNLQREARMPYADPAEDYAFALRATRRILNSGKNSVVSFSTQDSDAANASMRIPDSELILSPAIREAFPDIPIVAMEDFLPKAAESGARGAAPSCAMEKVAEEPAVLFQDKRVRGGVRFLELHAACPFRAFAELRLGTRPLEEPDEGLSPRDQGSIAHAVLERFWEEMKSQKGLLDSTSEQHRESLRRHIRDALAKFSESATEPWQKSLLAIEAERLEERLLEWLEQEKLRPDFTVMQTESTLEGAQMGGIELRCRVDRIDRVAQGVVLVDYKTGPVKRNSCEGDRPDQPQLPAYAVLRDQAAEEQAPLAGVAFAGLHPKKVEFTVIGSLAAVFSKGPEGTEKTTRRSSGWNADAMSAPEMQNMQARWNASLTRLAEDFRAGAAIVDPKKHEETCRYCAQTLLCRIRETAASDAAEQEPAGYSSDENVEI